MILNHLVSRSLPNGDNDLAMAEVYFLCKDGRILPALGQQTFAMIEIEHPNMIRLHNASKELSESIADVLTESGWTSSDNEKDSSKKIKPNILKYNVLEYKRMDDYKNESINDQNADNIDNRNANHQSISLPFQNGRSSKELKLEEQLEAAKNQLLIGKLLLAMNQQGLNLYATTQLTNCGSSTTNNVHRSQFIFRQSNVGYTQSMCLNLSGTQINNIFWFMKT